MFVYLLNDELKSVKNTLLTEYINIVMFKFPIHIGGITYSYILQYISIPLEIYAPHEALSGEKLKEFTRL